MKSHCTCGRERLPLFHLADGRTRCYPCLALDKDPLVGKLFVAPDKVQPARGWSVGVYAVGIAWSDVVEMAQDPQFARAHIREP